MQLVEEDRLQLDVPIWTYVPRYRELIPVEYQATPLTLLHLLTHMGGIAHHENAGTPAMFIAPPGTRPIYSNSGFGVIGDVLQAVEGRPYSSIVAERIARPGALSSLRTDDGFFAAAALVRSTIADLARYTIRVMDNRYVSPNTLYGRMLVQYQPGQGLGFGVQGQGQDVLACHAGAANAERSFMYIWPQRRHSVVMFCSAPDASTELPMGDVADAIDRVLADADASMVTAQ